MIMAAALGVVAYAAADMVHEAAGHALVASIFGIRVISISTVATSTAAPSRSVAAAGTIANILFGAIALALVAQKRRFGAASYSLWLFGLASAMNVGYLMFSGLFDSGDWAAVIAGARPSWAWRLVLVGAGFMFYTTVIRVGVHTATPWIADGDTSIADLRRLVRVSYLTGGVLLVLGSALSPIGRDLILISGVGVSFGLTVGLLLIPGLLQSGVREPGWTSRMLGLQPAWIVVATLVGVVFVGILGPGIRLTP